MSAYMHEHNVGRPYTVPKDKTPGPEMSPLWHAHEGSEEAHNHQLFWWKGDADDRLAAVVG